MERRFVFISHANPEDNYFSAWLASKLKVLGYDVWLDMNDISVGTSFNSNLQPIIQKQSSVFIAVNSEAYVEKANDQHRGVAQELNCAKTVNTEEIGHNFIIPVRIDNLDFANFPYHIQGWKAIDFYNNWQNGLIELVKELENFNIPKQKNIINPTGLWFQAIKSENKVIEREETYYSNWFEIEKTDFIFIHKPKKFDEEEIHNIPYPLITEANHIISFFAEETANYYVQIEKTHKYKFEDFLKPFIKLDDIFAIIEPKKKLIKLLNKSFREHLFDKGLVFWNKENRSRDLFYFRHPAKGRAKRISLKKYGFNRRSRGLTGVHTELIGGKKNKVNWSFAIKSSAFIKEKAYFQISYSVVFTDKDFKRFDTEIQHKLRRKIPSDWYNRKWFEMLLASMLKISISDDSDKIAIIVGIDKYLYVKNEPFKAIANVGYKEPKND